MRNLPTIRGVTARRARRCCCRILLLLQAMLMAVGADRVAVDTAGRGGSGAELVAVAGSAAVGVAPVLAPERPLPPPTPLVWARPDRADLPHLSLPTIRSAVPRREPRLRIVDAAVLLC